MSASTRAQAEARRGETLAEIEDAPKVPSRFSRDTTVAELTEWWLDSVARHQVRTSTLDSYRRFAGYLADDIGALPVVEVGAETITAWQSKLLDRYAPFTVLNCRKVCRQAFMEAVKVGLIASSPFDLVKAPKAKRVNAGRALTPVRPKHSSAPPNHSGSVRQSRCCSAKAGERARCSVWRGRTSTSRPALPRSGAVSRTRHPSWVPSGPSIATRARSCRWCSRPAMADLPTARR